jgi:predicted metal-binding protein
MADKTELERLFKKRGFADFRWFDPKEIVVAQWVRMKCQFGCPEYGRTASCPPNTPTIAECERFFGDYREAVIFHFARAVAKPEDRFAWTRELHLKFLDLEREVFCAGHEKAFLLVMDSCALCAECAATREECKEPKRARPTPEAMGVDVFSTVRKTGYPIRVLSDYDQTMNRYAFLLIE